MKEASPLRLGNCLLRHDASHPPILRFRWHTRCYGTEAARSRTYDHLPNFWNASASAQVYIVASISLKMDETESQYSTDAKLASAGSKMEIVVGRGFVRIDT